MVQDMVAEVRRENDGYGPVEAEALQRPPAVYFGLTPLLVSLASSISRVSSSSSDSESSAVK